MSAEVEEHGPGWTAWVRRRALRSFPPDQLLPDSQPVYVASWTYVFGVATVWERWILTIFLLNQTLDAAVMQAKAGLAAWRCGDVEPLLNSARASRGAARASGLVCWSVPRIRAEGKKSPSAEPCQR